MPIKKPVRQLSDRPTARKKAAPLLKKFLAAKPIAKPKKLIKPVIRPLPVPIKPMPPPQRRTLREATKIKPARVLKTNRGLYPLKKAKQMRLGKRVRPMGRPLKRKRGRLA